MGTISIEGMEFFAYHGCYEEERIIGGKFMVDLSFETDTGEAEISDDLNGTVNYQKVYDIVRKQMEIKAKLLEHLTRRIADAVCAEFPAVSYCSVTVSKLNPPVGGKVDKISFTLGTGCPKSVK